MDERIVCLGCDTVISKRKSHKHISRNRCEKHPMGMARIRKIKYDKKKKEFSK